MIGPIAAGFVLLGVFGVIEMRSLDPLVDFRLFRQLNYLAANISQFLAGMIELGLGYLLPYLLLLVIGVDPAIAGIALIPSTIPIVWRARWPADSSTGTAAAGRRSPAGSSSWRPRAWRSPSRPGRSRSPR